MSCNNELINIKIIFLLCLVLLLWTLKNRLLKITLYMRQNWKLVNLNVFYTIQGHSINIWKWNKRTFPSCHLISIFIGIFIITKHYLDTLYYTVEVVQFPATLTIKTLQKLNFTVLGEQHLQTRIGNPSLKY